jgi:hypothetical protein
MLPVVLDHSQSGQLIWLTGMHAPRRDAVVGGFQKSIFARS